jgi:hypothetical protein
VHLASIGIAEFADLQIDNHETPEATVEEHEIHAEPTVVDPQTTLPAEKREVVAELQQKIRQVLNQRFFKIRL